MLKIVKDKNEWDEYLRGQNASFLQSFAWGQILEKTGQKIERVCVENGENKILATVVYKKLWKGRQYAFCPKGPVVVGVAEKNNELFEEFWDYLKKNHCIFARAEPDNLDFFRKVNYCLVKDINPPTTLILDVQKSDEDILNNFHSKTRYNINLAGRKGIVLKTEKNFADFWQLLQKTGSRDGFTLHPEASYRAVVANENTYLLIAYFNDKPVASACFVGFDDTFYYLYGASDHDFRNLMAPYLLQWEGIKLAKKIGYKYYDFFGIAPKIDGVSGVFEKSDYQYDPNHRYAGVTKFKMGFFGKIKQLPGTFDVVLSSFWYKIYQGVRRLRNLIK